MYHIFIYRYNTDKSFARDYVFNTPNETTYYNTPNADKEEETWKPAKRLTWIL